MKTNKTLDAQAIEYHRIAPAGKLEIRATKPMGNRHDLSLAYSPGVAAACELIAKDAEQAYTMTTKGNLVGIISNGTAVLGLGNIGALASKPVMEGKAVLFKRFGDINAFDLEVDETDVDRFCQVVSSLEPTFGGINLEDIKAPECFEIEKKLQETMNIPVFHDDQHGTAITASAALINGLDLANKEIAEVRIVCNGAGAAGLACLNMFIALGARVENITLCDSRGVVYKNREHGINKYKSKFANETEYRTLADAMVGADVFIGVSKPNTVTKGMVRSMADTPLVFAMANPNPEILPEDAKAARPDVICATGRSDFPNQVNNVLCFPFIFRGALDVGARCINDEMKVACAHAVAKLARLETDDAVQKAYVGEDLKFGSEMLIPKPFDGRLMLYVPPAVAKAAMDSGVATRPIEDFDAYKRSLERLVYRSAGVMQPIFNAALGDPKRLVMSDGDNSKVLQAIQIGINEGIIVHPTLIGNRSTIECKMAEFGLRFKLDEEVLVLDTESEKYQNMLSECESMGLDHHGVAMLLLERNQCDAVISGVDGDVKNNFRAIRSIIGLKEGSEYLSGTHCVLINEEPVFLTDTVFADSPCPQRLLDITRQGVEVVKTFGLTPRVAVLSHSNFGSSNLESAQKSHETAQLIHSNFPELSFDGEMSAEAALNENIRNYFKHSKNLTGFANLLIMPNLDAASIAYRMLKTVNNFTIGPILSGSAKPVHIMNGTSSIRSIYNMMAYSVAQVQK